LNGYYSQSSNETFEIDYPFIKGGRINIQTDGNVNIPIKLNATNGNIQNLNLTGNFSQNSNETFEIDYPFIKGGRFNVQTDGNINIPIKLNATNGNIQNLTVGNLVLTNLTVSNISNSQITSLSNNNLVLAGEITSSNSRISTIESIITNGNLIASSGNLINATITNLIASSGNLINATITNLIASSGNLININSTNGNLINATITNLLTTNISSSTLNSSNGSFINNTITNLLTTNISSSTLNTSNGSLINSTITNLINTNISSINLNSSNGNFTNLTVGNIVNSQINSISNKITTIESNVTNGNILATKMVLQQQGSTILLQGDNLRPSGLETVYNGVSFGADIRMDCNNTFSASPNYSLGVAGGTFGISTNNPLFYWVGRASGQTNGSTIATLDINGIFSPNGLNCTKSTITNLQTTNITGNNGVFTNLSVGNLITNTVTNISSVTATLTSATITNLQTTNITGNNGVFTNLSVGNLITSTVTNISSATATLTSATITNLIATNTTITNLITTKITGINSAGGSALDFALNDNYADLRVIRNSTNPSDKNLYLNYQAGATSSTFLYSNNANVLSIVDGNKCSITGALSVSTSITTANLLATSSIGVNQLQASNITTTSLLATSSIGVNQLQASNITTTSLLATGNVNVLSNVNGPPTNLIIKNTNSGSSAYTVMGINNNNDSGLFLFLNSSTRSADGGANTATIRNDIGQLRLQNGSSQSTITLNGTTTTFSNNIKVTGGFNIGDINETSGFAIKNGNNSNTHFNYQNSSINYIRGNTNVDGNMRMNGNTIFLRSGTDNAGLKYNSTIDGPELYGYAGGALAANGTNMMTWTSSGCQFGNIWTFKQSCRSISGVNIILRSDGDTQVGSIENNGSNVYYYVSSDYRLKENIKPMKNSLDKLMKIKPYNYNFKTTPNIKSNGFLAHELQEILPHAVKGEKDSEEIQQVDYSKVIPLLVSSLQELKYEIEFLKKKLKA
jgi:hypothetical protein